MKPSAHKKRIFIVDDNEFYLEGLKNYLNMKHEEWEIFCFTSGESCLYHLYLKPDIVILDYHLMDYYQATITNNKINGDGVLQQIQAKNDKTNVIFISKDADVNQYKDNKMIKFLFKDHQTFQKIENLILEIETKELTKEKLQIAVIDDDELFLEGIKILLEDHHPVEVETFSNEDECISSRFNPSIVILDYHLTDRPLPCNLGLKHLEKIKNKMPKSKVIMMTNESDLNIALDAIKNGAFDYCLKNKNGRFRLLSSIGQLQDVITLEKHIDKTKKIFVAGLVALTIGSALFLIS